jgi:uncharacterized membrane protein YesL
MRSLFNAEGPLMRALSELMNILIINLCTLLCCIPIVTAGAALSSMHYCILKVMDSEDGGLVKMYFRQFKGNLRSSTPVWLVVLFCAAFLAFDLYVFRNQGKGELHPLVIIVFVAAFILLALYVWLFPYMAKFENSFGATFKNAAILAVAKFPRTILMMAINVVIPFILTQDMRLIPLVVVFGLSLPAYLSALLYRSVIVGMVENAQAKQEAAAIEEGEGKEPEAAEEGTFEEPAEASAEEAEEKATMQAESDQEGSGED